LIKRRDFLKASALTSAAFVLPETIHSEILEKTINILPGGYVHIRGKVTSSGKGIAKVVISDGDTVVQTDTDGNYEFVSKNKFVFMSIPSGYKIPQNKTGTAKFYKQLDLTGKTSDYSFELEKEAYNDNHSFLLLADPQTRNNEDMKRFHNETVPDINQLVKDEKLSNVFGVSNGDIMYDDLTLYPQYEEAVSKMGIPFFQVLGNHDCIQSSQTDEQSISTFQQHFGPTNYSFNKGKVHYVVLDDIFWFKGYMGYINQKQLDWINKDLSFVEKGKPVVVFVHIPPYTTQAIRYERDKEPNGIRVVNKELLYNLLKPFNAHIICGHTHESQYIEDSGIPVHVCGAVCGAWWTSDMCFDGTPNGYSIYTVEGENITWKYKSTGKSFNHQMKLLPPNSKFNKTDELIANVWGYDKHWTVEWFEDGKLMGIMENRRGLDPETVHLFEGKNKPPKHSWIEPMINDHLFYAKPSKGTKKITVKVTDRWGRIYEETVLNS
jgi:Icc-related predicted phosphoesterase